MKFNHWSFTRSIQHRAQLRWGLYFTSETAYHKNIPLKYDTSTRMWDIMKIYTVLSIVVLDILQRLLFLSQMQCHPFCWTFPPPIWESWLIRFQPASTHLIYDTGSCWKEQEDCGNIEGIGCFLHWVWIIRALTLTVVWEHCGNALILPHRQVRESHLCLSVLC